MTDQPISQPNPSQPNPYLGTNTKLTCSKCGGFREPDSKYGSYCTECGKAYHRDRYRAKQKLAGHTVRPRNSSDPNSTQTPEEIDEMYRQWAVYPENTKTTCPVCERPNQILHLIPRMQAVLNDTYNSVWQDAMDKYRANKLPLMAALVCNDCIEVLVYIARVPNLLRYVEFYANNLMTEQDLSPVELRPREDPRASW